MSNMENDETKQFLCDLCYEAFTAPDALSEHKQDEHKQNCLFICCHCKEVFTAEEELNEHIQANSCKYLDVEMGSGTDTDKKPYLCTMCSAAFIDSDSLISHKVKHEKEFTVEEGLNNQLDNYRTLSSDVPMSCNFLNSEDSDGKYHLVSLSSETSDPASLNFITLEQQNDVKVEKQQMKPPSSVVLYQCDRCDRSFTQKLQLTYHIITHKYDKHKCDYCGKVFVTAKELKKHSCTILNFNQGVNVKSAIAPSSTGSHLENSDAMKTESTWSEDANVNFENFSPSREVSKSFDSLDNLVLNGRVLEQQIISRPQKFGAVLHEIGNKAEFNIKYNEATSECKSGLTASNSNKKNYECYRCKRTFQEQIQLTNHRIKRKYSMCKCNNSDKKCRISPHLKRHSLVRKPRRTCKKSNWLLDARLEEQQKYLCNLRNCNLRHEKHHQTNNLSPQRRTTRCDKKLKCYQNDKLFAQKNRLSTYSRAPSEAKPFQCDQCNKAFKKKHHLTEHLKTHSKEKPFQCDQCDRAFTLKHNLTSHLKIHSGKRPFKCDQCDRAFTKKGNLIYHLRTHNGEKPFQCNQYDKAFARKQHLILHLRTHSGEKPFDCDQCDKTFSQKSHLRTHLRTHSGEKPFQCDQCDKTYAQRCHLNEHRRRHSGGKPFHCDQCDKAFAQRFALTQHLRLHSGVKPFQCDHCDKTFVQKGNLIVHLRRHSGEKPFQCDQCDKSFAQRGGLMYHLRMHNGEKPYECDQCDKAFARRGALIKHLQSHSGQKPFHCAQCGKVFAQKWNLTVHLRTHCRKKPKSVKPIRQKPESRTRTRRLAKT